MLTKKHYNIELSRCKQAERFMARPDVNISEKYKWVPELKTIIDKLSKMLDIIKDYTVDEALNGFGYEEEA